MLGQSVLSGAVAALVSLTALAGHAAEIQYADQGKSWTPELRTAFYTLDQGSRLIPFAWLQALRRSDGSAFTNNELADYGFLPSPDPKTSGGLPLGFALAAAPEGPMVSMGCAACHTRQIEADGKTYRIDGGPGFIDFERFVVDLNEAVLSVLKDDAAFAPFASHVLGTKGGDRDAVAKLHQEVAFWSARFDAYIAGSINAKRHWGPGRMDAMQLIFNQVAGVDIGPPPTYVMKDNIKVGDAPVRYPFVWNAAVQDHVQWGGFSKNGSDIFALTRNLGQVYGVFGSFIPRPLPEGSKSPINRDYLSKNSANFPTLLAAENDIKQIGPPAWPWAVDAALAKQGEAIFNRKDADGGCVSCHGLRPGTPRPPVVDTWYTPRLNVGTDMNVWDHVLLREVDTGSLEGASVPEYFPPLKKKDAVLSLLEVAVLGSILEFQGATQTPEDRAKEAKAIEAAKAKIAMQDATRSTKPEDKLDDSFKTHVFESRVLQGIWAAAPYLHNGSVPTLDDLLKPASERPTTFKVGPTYDRVAVGLAKDQASGAFTYRATSCEDVHSGDSNCGHEYGTQLKPEEKKALLEYLKTL